MRNWRRANTLYVYQQQISLEPFYLLRARSGKCWVLASTNMMLATHAQTLTYVLRFRWLFRWFLSRMDIECFSGSCVCVLDL